MQSDTVIKCLSNFESLLSTARFRTLINLPRARVGTQNCLHACAMSITTFPFGFVICLNIDPNMYAFELNVVSDLKSAFFVTRVLGCCDFIAPRKCPVLAPVPCSRPPHCQSRMGQPPDSRRW